MIVTDLPYGAYFTGRVSRRPYQRDGHRGFRSFNRVTGDDIDIRENLEVVIDLFPPTRPYIPVEVSHATAQ